jgi:hypothetical protein
MSLFTEIGRDPLLLSIDDIRTAPAIGRYHLRGPRAYSVDLKDGLPGKAFARRLSQVLPEWIGIGPVPG